MIAWDSFIIMFLVTIFSSCLVVMALGLGLRLLSNAGIAVVVEPAEFPEQIAKNDKKRVKALKKAAKKIRKKASPWERRLNILGAIACFIVAAAAVLWGIYLIVA